MEDNDFILSLIISHISNDITEEERDLLEKLKQDQKVQDLYDDTFDLLMSDDAVKGRAEISKLDASAIRNGKVSKQRCKKYWARSIYVKLCQFIQLWRKR